MKELLKQAGVCNCAIFANGGELYGYYECEKSIAFGEKTHAESPVVDRRNAYTHDILELEMEPVTGAQPMLESAARPIPRRRFECSA